MFTHGYIHDDLDLQRVASESLQDIFAGFQLDNLVMTTSIFNPPVADPGLASPEVSNLRWRSRGAVGFEASRGHCSPVLLHSRQRLHRQRIPLAIVVQTTRNGPAGLPLPNLR